MMKNLSSLTAIFALLGASQVFAQGPSVRAKLEFTPNHTLPAIPVVASLALTNLTSGPFTIGRDYGLAVSVNGAPSVPLRAEVGPHASGDGTIPAQLQYGEEAGGWLDRIALKQGETKTFFFAPSSLVMGNDFFSDGTFSKPGTYDVTLTLRDGTIRSNTARLVVDDPKGEDLAVWSAAMTRGGGKWRDVEWQANYTFGMSHSASRYFVPSALLAMPGGDDNRVAAIRALLAKDIPSPFKDVVRLALAEAYEGAADHAWSRGNIDEAARQADAGRAVLDDLSSTSQTDYGRVTAEAVRPNFLSRQDWQKLYTSTHQPKPQPGQTRPVVPTIDCGDGAEGKRGGLVFFGYDNPNEFDVEIQVGPENAFEPPPTDRGQLTVFETGHHRRAFELRLSAGEIVKWTLDGTTVTNRTGPKCSDSPAAQASEDRH
jgi:hypothetical protein